MNITSRLGACQSPIELPSRSAESLINLQSHIDPDGSAVAFDLSFTNQLPFRARIDLADMAMVYAEIHHASQVMLFRQGLTLDRGEEQLLELTRQSEHPDRVDVVADPLNGDRVFLHQFANRPPFAFRLQPLDVVMYLEKLRRTLTRRMH